MYYYKLISSMLKAVISSLGTGLYAVYKGESNALASLTTSLYVVYKGESNATDSLGTYNGTAQGGLTYTTGKSGNAFVGNGTNASVNLPNNSLNLTGNFSVSCWVKIPSASAGIKTIISNNKLLLSPTRQYGWGCYINNTNVTFQKYDGSSTVLGMSYDLAGILNANVWNLFTFTYSTTAGRKIYFNGSLVASDSNVTAIAYDTTHYPTLLAQRYDGTNYEYFNSASLDELNIWSKELTSTEITELYNSGNGKFYQNNAFYSTVVNDSLGAYNGTAQGGVSYIAGKSGNAFDLNGTTGNVAFSNGAFNFASDFSISMWVNYDVVKSSQMFISNLTIGASVRGWFIESTANSLRFRGFNSGGSDAFNVLKSSYTPSTGTWIHYVFVHKNNDNRMYENGTLIASDTSSATHCGYDNPNYPMIGANKYDASTTQEPFDGKIDETNLWSRALTATEVTELYNAGTGKFYPTF